MSAQEGGYAASDPQTGGFMGVERIPRLDSFRAELGVWSRSAYCPNCSLPSSFTRSKGLAVWPEWRDELHMNWAAEGVILEVWECLFCHETVSVLHRSEHGFEQETFTAIVWPPQPVDELPPEAPTVTRSLFAEASGCEHQGYRRGAAALLRACVESILDDRDVSEGNLKVRIDALKDGDVDPDLVKDLHEARIMGNWSLHDALEFGADEVADVAALIEDAVQVLYVQPAQRERMRSSRANRRQEHKRGPAS
jgi:hypothetical protein